MQYNDHYFRIRVNMFSLISNENRKIKLQTEAEPNKMVLAKSQLCKHLQEKTKGFSMSPFHADFENVLNFIPSFTTSLDIAETVNCFQNNS